MAYVDEEILELATAVYAGNVAKAKEVLQVIARFRHTDDIARGKVLGERQAAKAAQIAEPDEPELADLLDEDAVRELVGAIVRREADGAFYALGRLFADSDKVCHWIEVARFSGPNRKAA